MRYMPSPERDTEQSAAGNPFRCAAIADLRDILRDFLPVNETGVSVELRALVRMTRQELKDECHSH